MSWLEAIKELGALVNTVGNAELHQELSAVTIEGAKLADEIATHYEKRIV